MTNDFEIFCYNRIYFGEFTKIRLKEFGKITNRANKNCNVRYIVL